MTSTPADNAARTTRFLALMDARRSELREELRHIFPATTSFVWEIGCGHGHFLAAYAHAHPGELCVGIDIVGERIGRAVRKRDRAKLTNLHFIQAEARLFLETLPGSTTFSRLFALFPDPWPKARHHKHRLMQPDFLQALTAKADENSRLYFRTDYVPYFEATQTLLHTHNSWTQVAEAWPFESETVFQSRAPSYRSLVARPTNPITQVFGR